MKGADSSLTVRERERLQVLELENLELRQTNESLLLTLAYVICATSSAPVAPGPESGATSSSMKPRALPDERALWEAALE